jgi:hypothetical protein
MTHCPHAILARSRNAHGEVLPAVFFSREACNGFRLYICIRNPQLNVLKECYSPWLVASKINKDLQQRSLYTVIKIPSIILKKVVCEVILSRKCIFFQNCDRFRVTTLLRWYRFYFVIVDIYKMAKISFNIICWLILVFAMKWNSALCSIFNRFLRVLLEQFSVPEVGTCPTSYRYYCPSLIIAL